MPGPSRAGLIHTRHLPEGIVETAANALRPDGGDGPRLRRDRRGVVATRDARAGAATSFATGVRDAGRCSRVESGRWPRGWRAPIATRATRPRAGETVEAWGHRVAGRAATEWLIAPALAGIYGRPPIDCRRERSSARDANGDVAHRRAAVGHGRDRRAAVRSPARARRDASKAA